MASRTGYAPSPWPNLNALGLRFRREGRRRKEDARRCPFHSPTASGATQVGDRKAPTSLRSFPYVVGMSSPLLSSKKPKALTGCMVVLVSNLEICTAWQTTPVRAFEKAHLPRSAQLFTLRSGVVCGRLFLTRGRVPFTHHQGQGRKVVA